MEHIDVKLKRMPYAVRVGNIPGGLSEFITLQAAVDYCDNETGDWVIQVWPGRYDEIDITPNGGANITIKAMGEGRVEIWPTGDPVAAVIVSGFTLHLEDIIVSAFSAGFPALRITGGACETCNCILNGVGAGDAIQMVDGTLHLNDSQVPIGDVDLDTLACTLTAVDTDFDGTIDTAGAVIHTITLFNCDLGGQVMNLAATGACVYAFHNCMNMSTITDASLLGTGHLCQSDVVGAGLVVTGTSAWIVDNSGVVAVSNTDGTTTATIAIYGGIVLAITRAVGSVVWWLDGNTLKVIPSGTATDTVLQWAVNAAAAGDTIVFHPGIYTEPVVLAAGINLVGIDREQCLIDVADGTTGITMAEGCRVGNFRMLVTASGGNSYGIQLNNDGAVATPLYLEDIRIHLVRTGGNAYGIAETVGNANAVIYFRNVRVTSDTDTNETALHVTQPNKTFHIEECWLHGGDYAIYCDQASLFWVDHTFLDVEVVPPGGGTTIYGVGATYFFRNCTIEKQITIGDLGIARMKACAYREINRTGSGNIVDESPDLKDAPWVVHKWDWMAALPSMDVAVRGTPRDAGSSQILLEVTDDGADVEAVETNPALAGSLANIFHPVRTPRFITQVSVDAFDAHTTQFFGLRETLGDYTPDITTEECAGFDWNGTNFRAISSDGGGAGVATNLTTPSTDVQHQLEVIVFGSNQVEFYVDGILVATHNTAPGIPAANMYWQHELETAGAGGGDLIQVTVRNGGCQECPY